MNAFLGGDVMNRSIVCAAFCLGLASANTAAAAVFLEEHAYRAAVGGLVVGEGRVIAAVPFYARVVQFEDGFGEFTDPSETVEVAFGGVIETVDRQAFARANGGPGALDARLGCSSATFPCLGAWSIAFAFDRKVLGFGGLLSYVFGDEGLPGGLEAIPFLDEPFRAAQEAEPGTRRYFGFFGRTEPMTGFTLDFRRGQNADDWAWVTFTGHMLVEIVPEPGTVALFAGALGLLGLAAAPAAARRRPLSPSAGSR